jgi:adenylate cyclase
MKKIYLLILIQFCLQSSAKAQNQILIDSLQNELKNFNNSKQEVGTNKSPLYDSTAANILSKISYAYWGNDHEKALYYAKETLTLSEKIGYKKGIASAYNSFGKISMEKGEYTRSMDFFIKSLNICEEIGFKKGVAGAYNNMGIIHEYQGDFPLAIKNYFASLKIKEEIGDKKGISNSYTNIGNIYKQQENLTEALKCYKITLKITEDLGDKKGIADSYNNIGNVYNSQANYSEALKNYTTSLQIREEIGDKSGVATSHINIGSVYDVQKNYPKALSNFILAADILENSTNKNLLSSAYTNIGTVYTKQNNYRKAESYLNKSLILSEEIGYLEELKYVYESFSALDSAKGDFRSSLMHYKKFIIARDSALNNENAKKITQQQMQYDFDKEAVIQKADQDKKDALGKKELQKQKLVRNGFVSGFAVMLLFAGVFLRQRNKISGEKKISEAERKKSNEEMKRSEDLLLNILPEAVATELKLTGKCQPKTFSMVTVMFADFKDFTSVSEKISAELLVYEINYCFSAFDKILEKYKIEKIKTVGDAYLCASGLPDLSYTHAVDVVNAAIEMRDFIIARNDEKKDKGEISFELRIGIHSGSVVAGIVGIKKFSYDIWGDTVNLAARMESSCEPGQVNISGTTFGLVKNKFSCIHRGKIQAKNKGEVEMYFVESINETVVEVLV